jgi:hypothetical protein
MTDTEQPRCGRRAFEPTVEQHKNVNILVALGIPERAICAIVRDHKDRPISEKTLRKYFRREIEIGAAELIAQIGLFIVATMLGLDPPEGVKPITDEKM